MATLDDVLLIQKQQGILMAPTSSASAAVPTKQADVATSTSSTLSILLQNNTPSTNLYVSISGLDINNNNAVWLLQSDGATPYYPANPPANQQPLQANCAIAVGGPGASRTVTVPQVAGARVWFSRDTPLTFLLNQGPQGGGPGLVEPSVTNASDPNYQLYWDFVEFTFNSAELYANVTYVDFVGVPAAMTLESSDGSVQTVQGLPQGGLDTVCAALRQQAAADGFGWDKLVVSSSSSGGADLRALSPNSGIVMHGVDALFPGYYDPYVDAVWQKYASASLSVNTQVSWGQVTGRVGSASGDETLDFAGVGSFPRPSTADVFSCSTGAFAAYPTNGAEMGNIAARLAAAFNRSTLLLDADQPDGERVETYYGTSPTNHYARVVHATSLDGRGYAFPYDDVGPSGGEDQSGAVASGNPQLLSVFIGGGAPSSASTSSSAAATTTVSRRVPLREMARPGRQLVGGRRGPGAPPIVHRRGLAAAELEWASAEEEKEALLVAAEVEAGGTGGAGGEEILYPATLEKQEEGVKTSYNVDLEKGATPAAGGSHTGEEAMTRSGGEGLAGRLSSLLLQLQLPLLRRSPSPSPSPSPASTPFRMARPVVDAAAALLSLGLRTLLGRAAVAVCLVLIYLLLRVVEAAGTGARSGSG